MNFELNQTQSQQKNNFRFPNLTLTRQVTEMSKYCSTQHSFSKDILSEAGTQLSKNSKQKLWVSQKEGCCVKGLHTELNDSCKSSHPQNMP